MVKVDWFILNTRVNLCHFATTPHLMRRPMLSLQSPRERVQNKPVKLVQWRPVLSSPKHTVESSKWATMAIATEAHIDFSLLISKNFSKSPCDHVTPSKGHGCLSPRNDPWRSSLCHSSLSPEKHRVDTLQLDPTHSSGLCVVTSNHSGSKRALHSQVDS